MKPSKRSLALWIFALVFFVVVFLVRIRDDMVDFEVNLRAGQRLASGESLYQPGDGHFMFKYFPSAALLYMPLALLPLDAAKTIWYLISLGCSIGLFYLSRRLVTRGSFFKAPWYVIALPPIVLAKFFFRELKLGQINTLVGLLLLLMTAELLREASSERDARAGALWGLATALKPYGLIFFPYFLVKRNWAALASGALLLGCLLMIPAAFYGFRGNLTLLGEWYGTLAESTPAQLVVADNIPSVAFFSKWLGASTLATILGGLAVLLMALLVLALLWRGRNLDSAALLECAFLMIAIPLVSPLGWDYQLLLSVVGVTLLSHHLDDFAPLARRALVVTLVVIGLSIYDVIGRSLYRSFMDWSILTPCYAIVVVCLASLRLRQIR